jgi:hypothetical protein
MVSPVTKNISKEPEPKTLTLSPEDYARIEQFLQREMKNGPRLKVTGQKIAPDHAHNAVGAALLGQALGSANTDFIRGFVWQLAKLASPVGDFDENRLNFIASIITDNHPRDQNEAMLTAQMAAVHLAMMSFAGYMATADNLNLPKLDGYQRALNALGRTFVIQLEALRRYRTGGEHKVTIAQATQYAAQQDTAEPNASTSVEAAASANCEPKVNPQAPPKTRNAA